jgi:hypothetical protein
MPRRQPLAISTFDGQLLDGLDFCRMAYDLFDQMSGEPDGIAKTSTAPDESRKEANRRTSPYRWLRPGTLPGGPSHQGALV